MDGPVVRLLLILMIAGSLAAAAGCSSFPPGNAAPGGPAEIGWRSIAPGVDLAEITSTKPPLRVYCLRVDTGGPGVEVIVTPPEEAAGPGDAEYPGRRTSTFLERFGLVAAVNGSPFRPVRLNEGKPTDVVGVSVYRSEIISPPDPAYDCLVRYPAGDFAVISQAEIPPDIGLAVGGFHKVLENGKAIGGGESSPVRHPRTGVGTSRSGLVLYLVVIDGRNPASSIGATEAELAGWLAYFGAWDGLNLDGGGSSTLVVADGEGNPRRVNRPLGYGRLGMERVVGNHLGISAAPHRDEPPGGVSPGTD